MKEQLIITRHQCINSTPDPCHDAALTNQEPSDVTKNSGENSTGYEQSFQNGIDRSSYVVMWLAFWWWFCSRGGRRVLQLLSWSYLCCFGWCFGAEHPTYVASEAFPAQAWLVLPTLCWFDIFLKTVSRPLWYWLFYLDRIFRCRLNWLSVVNGASWTGQYWFTFALRWNETRNFG